MHLTLGFLSSNIDFGVSLTAYLRHKNHQRTILEPHASCRHTFLIFLGANMTPKTSPRPPNTPPEATQEPLKSSATPPMSHAKQPSSLAITVQDRQEPQKPRKGPSKVDGVPLRASFWALIWMHLDPLTQLLCDFFRGLVAGSQLCCAVDPPRQALCLRMAYRVPHPNEILILISFLIFLKMSRKFLKDPNRSPLLARHRAQLTPTYHT